MCVCVGGGVYFDMANEQEKAAKSQWVSGDPTTIETCCVFGDTGVWGSRGVDLVFKAPIVQIERCIVAMETSFIESNMILD